LKYSNAGNLSKRHEIFSVFNFWWTKHAGRW
jgi:hypothetical protein